MAEKTSRTLAIETSSRRLSVAVGDDRKILAVYRSPLAWRHSETLFAAIERVMKRAGWKPAQLTGVAASLGPGSFTGIRIGLAVARTLGQTLRIPVVGVTSLKTMAYGAAYKTSSFVKKKELYAPEIDALSDKIFTALYEKTKNGSLRRVLVETHTTTDDWKLSLKSRRPIRITENPDAADLLALARPALRLAGADSYKNVLPLYLRRPAAQERLKTK